MPPKKFTSAHVESLSSARDKVFWEKPGFGIRVLPNGNRSWLVQYRDKTTGQTRRKSLGKFPTVPPSAARRKADDILARAQLGEDPVAEQRRAREEARAAATAAREHTFAAVFDRWHSHQLSFGKWKPDSAREVKRMFEADVLHVIGTKAIAEIERRDIQRVLRAKAGTPYAYNRLLTWLRALLTWSEREELRPAGSNPCASIDRYPEKRRDRALGLEELAAIGAGLRRREADYPRAAVVCDVLRLLALTGLRRREASRLEWAEVDLRAGVLNLADTKTGKRVKVLGGHALALLRRRHEAAERPKAGWVFPSERSPKRPVEDLSDTIAASCLDQDGEGVVEQYSAHVLRHTYATTATRLGVNPLVVSLMLGHRKKSDVTAGYIHLDPDDQIVRDAEERVGTLIGGALDGRRAVVVDLDARRR